MPSISVNFCKSYAPFEFKLLQICSFPHLSSTCFDILSWNFAHDFVLMYYRSSLSDVTLHQFLKEWCSFVNLECRKCEVFRIFPYMLSHIELKFCIWLYFKVLQIKLECRHFASIFEGVIPFCELRIWQMWSFPHLSPTCFDILGWKFAYDFVLKYFRSS